MSTYQPNRFSPEQNRTLILISRVAASISLASCVYVLSCFARIKILRENIILLLIFFLSLNDLGLAASQVVGNQGYDHSKSLDCRLQAYFISYFGYTTFIWSFCSALSIHKVVLYENWRFHRSMKNGSVLRIFFLFAQLLPAGLSLLPFATDSYGNAGTWCWITMENDYGFIWRGIMLLYTFGTLMYCFIVYGLSERKFQQVSEVMERMGISNDELIRMESIQRLKYYPISLVISNISGCVNRSVQFIIGPCFVLSCIHAASEPLQGFFDMIPFLLTPIVFSELTNPEADGDGCLGFLMWSPGAGSGDESKGILYRSDDSRPTSVKRYMFAVARRWYPVLSHSRNSAPSADRKMVGSSSFAGPNHMSEGSGKGISSATPDVFAESYFSTASGFLVEHNSEVKNPRQSQNASL
eukprot:jgi/Bigna1/144979/aug1.93_g19687